MTDCVNERQFSAAVIKYLLAMGELCDKNGKARSVDIAARINVSKPSAHSMINNLCAAGLAKKERYGAVYLTEEGKAAAARYGKCYAPLHRLCGNGHDETEKNRAGLGHSKKIYAK